MSSHQSTIESRVRAQCRSADQAMLLRLLKKSLRDKSSRQYKRQLQEAIAQSAAGVERRRVARPRACFNPGLPFFDHREELADAISNHQVVVVCGETGSGKTTQLPQLCVELGLADRGLIGHTQPRRIAAQSVAARIAEELGSSVGEAVGYKIRFRDRSPESAYVKLMTDGILLAETRSDRWLGRYSTLIIDEAHERSLNIDLLLGYIKQLLPRRPDLKLIVTSATIDPDRFSRYFDDAPVINISGRGYPVEIRYRPPDEEARDELQALVDAVDELDAEGREDMLVFFPGERQIREAADRLSKSHGRDYDVLPLYARLSAGEQKRIFEPHHKRRIVLATNVAETSLTVPGIRYVIDTGLARLSRYSWRARVQRLPIERISRASANQRSGRCGRVAPGICIRLYDEDDFESRDEYTEAEVLRSNLASVILQMNDLRLGSIHDFDFIDSPDSRLINDGYRLLFELGATDREDRILKHGHRIAQLPVDPRLAQMLVRAAEQGCLSEILIIVSALSIQDPRSASNESRQAAEEKYRGWQDEGSDFIFWLRLWQDIEVRQRELTRNQFSRWCGKHFLSYPRLREWQDIHSQLEHQLREQGYRFNSDAADLQGVHRCLFSGIPSHIASFDRDRRYQATRGRQLMIFPGSALARQTPKWIMAFSLIETSRLYAHGVARFDPAWAMKDAVHLHQYEYYEPHWQARRGRVAAFRNTRIYGLLVESGKRVNFAAIDPKHSREIFIRHALVDGDYRTRVEAIVANRELVEGFRQQEEKYRRRDILVGDDLLFQFYDARLPPEAVDGPSFEAWARTLSSAGLDGLRFLGSDIADDSVDAKQLEGFPPRIEVQGQALSLDYLFEPGNEYDGVTVRVPLLLLNRFRDEDFDRLVPGLLREKIEALIRALPRSLRRNFVPVAGFANACHQRLGDEAGLLDSIRASLLAMTGVDIPPTAWEQVSLDTHLNMHYALVDGEKLLKRSHSLASLQADFGGRAQQRFDQQVQRDGSIAREGLVSWDFDCLPDTVGLDKAGTPLQAYPALVDYGDCVSIELFETPLDAAFYHPAGVARLYFLHLADSVKYLGKNLPKIGETALMYAAMGSRAELVEDMLMAAIRQCFLAGETPRSLERFLRLLEENRPRFVGMANELAGLVHRIMSLRQAVRRGLDETRLPGSHREDIDTQLANLIYAGFLRDIDRLHLSRMPTYLQAMMRRLDADRPPTARMDDQLETIAGYQRQYLAYYPRDDVDHRRVEDLRWMIEEFRIACFAQPIKTRVPVSEKKIEKLIGEIESSRKPGGVN